MAAWWSKNNRLPSHLVLLEGSIWTAFAKEAKETDPRKGRGFAVTSLAGPAMRMAAVTLFQHAGGRSVRSFDFGPRWHTSCCAGPPCLPLEFSETVFAMMSPAILSRGFATASILSAFLLSTAAVAQCNSGPPPGDRSGPPRNGFRGTAPPPPPYTGPGDTSPSSPASPSPASPNSPGPHTPNSAPRQPRGPNTPRGVPSTAPVVAPRGAAITFEHRRNALDQLRIDWDYPAFPPQTTAGTTVAPKVYRALPVDEAIQHLAGTDRRPLLVLRECWVCQGSERALLNAKEASEKTLLFTQWFHCIRLDDSARHETHPCYKLLQENGMPHLLLCESNGSTRIPLDGQHPQSQLWSAMRKVLRQAYTKDPDQAMRELFKVLAEHDHLDSREAEVSAQLQSKLDQHAKTSPAVRELEQELARIATQREDLKRRQNEIADLGLKTPALPR